MSVAGLLDSLPASVELAAGSGKTWTLAAAVRTVAEQEGRTLILTHTIAGVQAMRARLREFEIDPTSYHVATITSFAIELVCAYSQHAGFDVPDEIDLSRSNEYITGATAALGKKHIRDVYRVSFSHVLVDEYQDCSKTQHGLVLALKAAVSQTAVFGDRLQGIFGFADPIVDWQTDVVPEFPNFPMEQRPRRWEGHNQALGDWLLKLRPQMTPGAIFDMTVGLPPGVTYRSSRERWALINAARDVAGPDESVVVITGPAVHAPRSVASRLPGYVAMEEMGGSFMVKHLSALSALEPGGYPAWLAGIAKACFTGFAGVDKPVLNRLAQGPNGKSASDLKRAGLARTLTALDDVRANPTLARVAAAMREIRVAREGRLHSREAWHDLEAVVERCSLDPELGMLEELERVRERVRHGGRGRQMRVVSRTVLIKGLEYDHVIVANIADLSDVSNLYVALSRARKSVTILGLAPQVTLERTKTG